MFNYMKYEIKGTYKFIAGILALVLILITGLYAYLGDGYTGSDGGDLFIALSVMILFGTALATFLFIVGSFRKELYEDRGYLTFTLPLTGNQIVGSKLIVAFVWFAILGIVIFLYNIVMALSFSPHEIYLAEIFAMISKAVSINEIIFVIGLVIFSGVNMLVLIYFSMALGKVTFRNKRIGGLWFVLFLIISGILAYGQFGVEKLLPYYLDIATLKVGTLEMLSTQFNFEINNGVNFEINNGVVTRTGIPINIAASIYSVVTTVALFLGTGYLIEKKIDL